ncbi:ABC transporter ATP-binding protein [Cytobacillus sp. IB215316]|uniref:ABC transporter ATP-binding protein n=1 Tax=Cytobacillus sp. IB215316 TaxID=3097354 RepID=UPI002A164482|nr:ABC transporter ATP-binding protein [Cytobacillus sp. IB215316]MDX8361625.1 ABC transporter ATP-binding protein [Cytobacillus sp. IB215316]
MLEIVDIKKKYRKKEVLKGVSFTVEKGDFLAIIGKNGVGKTTLTNIICKLVNQDSGNITYGFNENEIYTKIGVQTQSGDFDDRLKVDDMCTLWRKIYKVEKSVVEALLERLDLTEVRKQYIKTLSGGQKQKLNILLSLLNDPELLILDELTTSLDAISRYEMRKYLKQLNEQGKTIIMISHYMDEVEDLCNKVVVLKDGKVEQTTTPKALLGNKYNSLQDYFVECV